MGVRERWEKKHGSATDEEKRRETGRESVRERYENRQKYSGVDTSGVNDAYFESYNQAANSFFSNKELREDSYDQWQALNSQADTIRAWAWQNRDKLGSNYDKIMSATDLSEAGQYWNQFKTAEDYAKEYGSYASYNEMMNADLGALEQDIADWEGRISDLEASTKIGYYAGQGRGLGEILESMSYGKDQLSSAEQQLAAKRAYYNEAKNMQAGKAYAEQARLDPEFANISANGAVIAPNGRRIENWVAYYRDPKNYDKTPSFSTGHYADNDQIDSLESIAGRHMEEDEFATYNYLLGKGDKKAAAAYLKSLEYQLNQREASSIAANLKGRPIAEVAWAIPTGLDQFGSGINSAISSIAGNDGYITPSSIQMSSGMVREDLSDYGFKVFGSSVGQIAYDTLNTTANMAPSILAATAVNMVAPGAGAYVGAGLMGLSAGGNAYAEALNNGYSKDNARAYGLFVGASEAALQSVLGGISSVSGAGNLTKAIAEKAGAIESALLRVAAQYGISVAGEITEEELQNFLEPLFRTIFLGEEYDLPTIEELVQTALVTALSTGALESGGIISSEVGTNKYYKDTYGGSQSELVAEGLELDPQSRYFQRLDEKLHQGKDLTGNEIRNVVTRNDRAIRNLGEAEVAVEQAETEAKQIAPETAQNAPKIAQERTEVTAEQTVAKTENKADAESATAEATPTNENVQEQLAQASKDYGKQAKAMVANYIEGQDVAEYSAAFRIAYDMGASGVKLSYVEGMDSYLTASQRKIAYEAGKASQDMRAKTIDKNNQKAASGGTVRKKGAVRGDGVSIDDLIKRFNDTQRSAYTILSTISEVTGIDIVLYKSEADAKGNFTDAQGKYKKSEPGTLYIDINAGLNNIKSAGDLANYTMMRTFSHEFVHFIENWNPVWYNELRRVVFDHIENADEMIAREAAESGLPYERASRDVIAEALTDILPDTSFIEDLANNHKNIFEKLLEKLKEFVASIKSHFATLTPNTNKGAQQLKESGKYFEDIVKLYDKVATEAVENYQRTVAAEEVEQVETEAETEAETVEAEADGSEFTITENREFGALEIKFEGKPSEAIRNVLKEHKFRWHGKKGVWYGKAERTDIVNALREAYKAEETAAETHAEPEKAKTATDILREMGGKAIDKYTTDVTDLFFPELAKTEPETESKTKTDVYNDLSNKLRKSIRVTENGLTFTVTGYTNEGFVGTIKRESERLGAYPIENARDKIYTSEVFNSYEDAVDDLVAVARMSNLLKGKQVTKTEEVNPNVENVDNRETVQQPVTDRAGDPRVLDEVEAADVQGDAPRGNSVGDAVERGQQAVRDDVRDGSGTGTGGRHGDGDRQSGDLRRNDGLTDSYAPLYDVHATLDSVMDKVSDNEIAAGISKAKNDYNVDDDELFSIIRYVRGDAYDLTRLQRAGENAEWSEFDTYLADQLISGLNKHPAFAGRTYRNLDFGTVFNAETDYDDFIRDHIVGKEVTLDAFTSASKNPNGYPVPGSKVVHLVIDGVSARDISETLGIGQEEVIYLPGTKYKVTKVTTANDGHPLIYGEEITANEVQELSRGTESTRQRRDETVPSGLGHDDRGMGGDGGGAESVRGSGEVEIHESGAVHADQERLRQEVTERIAQQSTEQPKGSNFVIGDSLDLPNGERARYNANVKAIKLVKQLEAENRYATDAEQQILSKYVGWGGLSGVFDYRKNDWGTERKELKELLTDEEYRAASASTTDAFYTDIPVIKAMYDGLAKLGFNGGRMLEPSSGVGNFVGAMPASMSAKVNSWTMVELDNITGLIAKYLYPNAYVRIQGFEKAYIPDNSMDVAIGNVPFGNVGIYDKAYPKRVTKSIHNYFFAKSLDKVRPGGIVMFITSSGTMNSSDNYVRSYLMTKADLLGAIRLPNTAFKSNAGTNVVADILIFKKRAENTAYAGEDFLDVSYDYNIGETTNDYFAKHPEMVLGVAELTSGLYGRQVTYKPLEGKGNLADQIREAFSHIDGKMEYPATLSREKTNFAVERANKKTKENGLVVKDGKVYQNKGGDLIEVDKAKGAAERISAMLEIRDAARNLMNYQQQGLNETEIKKARTELNKAYDDFVKKYGFVNAQANKNAFKEDPDSFSLFALENWNPETKKATKADIFSKNTVAPNRTVTSAKDVSEGLIVSVNQTGGVDTELIAKLTGIAEADVTRELIESRKAFKNRNGILEAAETYLSGNVRAKLRDAEALVPIDSDYNNNVEALRAVIPEDVGYQDIFVNPGTPWIPNSVYSDFAAYMLDSRNSEWRKAVDVTRNPETGNFTVELKDHYLKYNAANTQKWGTSRRTFIELLDAMLNSKSVVIKDKLDDGSFVINKDATAAANEKIENITKEFQDWLWRDEARRTELATLYNEVFNSVVTPKYNGDNLTVNGANALKPLRPHQRNAVQRVISSGGNTLLAHKVGAGKTYEMAAAAMKLKELGLVKKPMFVVPKSLVAQWGNEFIDFFPTAKLLVAEVTDFTASNRKVFMNRIANGAYDAVIVSYEQFEKLPMSKDFERQLHQKELDSVIAAIEEARADKRALSVKDLEKKRKSLQTKIDKLSDTAKDEGNIDFEQLGVDSLFVDEAHNFKNLFYTTSMTNVAGLGNKDGSKRAFDLYAKVRYLQQLNGGRGIVFATATPVMNSMSEMYIMQKYLQPDLLNQLGLNTFDAWAKQFGEVVNGVEIKPSGQGYRVKQSFSRFKNMSELQLLFRNFADVLTDIPGLKIPKMKGGKVNVVVCEPGQFQQDFMKELEQRADNIKNVDPSVDNMLKITSDGRKISYTQRMIDPSLPYEEGCKIFRCADNVIREYNESKANKGTQIIFCDMATPKGKSNNATETEDIETDMESAQLYEDLKTRLRQGGIPAQEIAFIHDADTDQKKKKLFADVNDGKVRVLIGSTGKMGVGMNAQKRIVAIHHLDAPWRPGDVEQRDGRAFRQGNINEEVSKYTYVTEGSFDARLWDILERKQNFINQIMNGESVGRDAEDTGEVTLSAAEVKALASGSPLIMEQVQLDTDIKKLESLYRAHISAIRSARERLAQDNGQIAVLEKQIANGESDMLSTVDTYSDGKFSITVGNKKYTDKKEAGVVLVAAAGANATADGYTKIGSFAGFELRVTKTNEGVSGLLFGKQGYPFKTYPGNPTYMTNHLIGVVESIEEKVNVWRNSLAELKKDIAEQEKLIAAPFAKQAELDQKRTRYNEVMDILNPKEEQSLDSVDEDTVQEQRRDNRMSDHMVLAFAADMYENDPSSMALSDAEKNAFELFKQRLAKLDDLTAQRYEQGQIYRENTFQKGGDRELAQKAHNRMEVLDGQIERASAQLLDVQEKTVLQGVLQKARKVVEQAETKRGDEKLKRWRERREEVASIKKYRDRILADRDELINWLNHPMNKDVTKHVNDNVKSAVIQFLLTIDTSSKQKLSGRGATKADEKHVKQAQKLLAMLDGLDDEVRYSGDYDLPLNFSERLQRHIDVVDNLLDAYEGDTVLNNMTVDELKDLSILTANLKAALTTLNKFHTNAMFAHVDAAGDNTVRYLRKMKDTDGNAIDNFVMWKNIRPAYAWERFGEGGESIYLALRNGQNKLAWNAKAIVSYAQDTFTAKERKDWENDVISVSISGDREIKVTAAALMSFYELSKRKQGRAHILNGGVTVSDVEIRESKKKQRVKGKYGKFTEADIETMIAKLTDRQKAVADKLQQYIEKQGGEWGNFVTLARFGENAFGENGYFPISVDKQSLSQNADKNPKGADLYRLLNMGFTKELSSNTAQPLMLYSIFDVFSTHMADMAQYNAMALPVLDAIRWLNYKHFEFEGDARVEKSNLRAELRRAFGAPIKNGEQLSGYSESFILHILQAYNGTEAQGTPGDTGLLKALHTYNRAQIAFNLRAAVQQPMSLTRAAMIIDPKYITKALNPKNIKQNVDDMLSHSGIAVWKDLGYYDINISRGLTQMIKQEYTFSEKVTEVGLKPAEWADKATWGVIWAACKMQLKAQGVTDYAEIEKLFDDVIYKTQVVDSVLTKSEYMRDKGFGARSTASFMSEPTTTASMLLGEFDAYRADIRRGLTARQAWNNHKKTIGKTVLVYSVSAILLSMVQAAVDGLRDDDDYQNIAEKWNESFWSNLLDEISPLNKLPLINTLWEAAMVFLDTFTKLDVYGNPPAAAWAQWFDTLTKAWSITQELIEGESNYTWYAAIYKYLQVASGLSGLPISAGTREVVTVWNNVIGTFAPSLKIKDYELKPMTEIKYAVMDGYLTADQAADELMKQELVYDREEAELTAELWAFLKDHKEYSDVSVSAYAKYKENCEGIDFGYFYQAWKYYSQTDAERDKDGEPISGSKKRKVLDFIYQMRLTPAQKKQLIKCFYK